MILGGGVNDLDWLVPEGQRIGQGESVLYAITGKILYLEALIAGIISFNKTVKQNLSAVAVDPYGSGWLFRIAPEIIPYGAAVSAIIGTDVLSTRPQEGGRSADSHLAHPTKPLILRGRRCL